jgi:hypothetical protein
MTNDHAGPRAIGSTKLIYGMEITYREEAVGNRGSKKENRSTKEGETKGGRRGEGRGTENTYGERREGEERRQGGEKEEELRLHVEEVGREKEE